jgi:hypothetical protein
MEASTKDALTLVLVFDFCDVDREIVPEPDGLGDQPLCDAPELFCLCIGRLDLFVQN